MHCVALLVAPRRAARDPEGETLAAALRRRGYSFIHSMRAGKVFILIIEAGSRDEAVEKTLRLASEARLYNPVVNEARALYLGEGSGC